MTTHDIPFSISRKSALSIRNLQLLDLFSRDSKKSSIQPWGKRVISVPATEVLL